MKLTFDYYGQQAYDIMQAGSDSLFLTGKAGTGKTTMMKHFLKTTEKNVLLLAPTGVAAINLGGSTLHSFFLYHPGITIDEVNEEEHTLKGRRRDVLQKADIVIIDEISMVRADMLDCIDKSMRMTMRTDEPFAGKQMIFVGDLYQLPPIVRNEEREYFREHYTSPFFFSSKAYEILDPQTIELQKIYRQRDDRFKEILNKIRIGLPSTGDLKTLNEKVGQEPDKDVHVITLVTTNADADRLNMEKLEDLDTEEYVAVARIDGEVAKSYYANSEVVSFKAGAQIMMLKNGSHWQNGSIGVLLEYDEDDELALVEIDGESYEIGRETWRILKPYYDKKEKKIVNEEVGTFKQVPFKLARAITIHKSQGLTFEEVKIDLGRRVFAGGQTYVALSRATHLDGLYLTRSVKKSDIMLDKRIRWFMGKALLKQKKEMIRKAIEEQKSLSFQYIKGDGSVTFRTITPEIMEEMIHKDTPFPGVSGVCHLRKEKRVFHVGRMFEVEMEDV